MIRIGFDGANGSYKIALVLEPENIDRLRRGQMIEVDLNELCHALPFRVEMALDYTPDAVWMQEEFQRRKLTTAEGFAKLLQESQSRPEVRKRPNHPPAYFTNKKADA